MDPFSQSADDRRHQRMTRAHRERAQYNRTCNAMQRLEDRIQRSADTGRPLMFPRSKWAVRLLWADCQDSYCGDGTVYWYTGERNGKRWDIGIRGGTPVWAKEK